MIPVTYDSIVTPELLAGNIDNNDFHGFLEDYRVLHCLLRRQRPTRVMEVGTHRGTGTRIIVNAVGTQSAVYSLDLAPDQTGLSKQHPLNVGATVGDRAKDLGYTQLLGDSMTYDFAQHAPIDAWFIDGEHDEAHVFREASCAAALRSALVIFHDSDIPEVALGIERAFADTDYKVYRVTGTRVAFASL